MTKHQPTAKSLAAVLATLWGALALGACAPDFRPASELIDEPQVLGIRATPPEVSPGMEVTLDALVHWPAGTPNLVWMICIPGVGDSISSCLANQLGDSFDVPFCSADPAARLCIANIGPTADFTVPEGIFPDDGEQHTFFVNMLAMEGMDFEACGDVLTGGSPTDSCLLSLKRVVVSYDEPDRLNENPLISHFSLDGSDLTPGTVVPVDSAGEELKDWKIFVDVTMEATSIDELFPPDADPVSADLVVSYFADCGRPVDEKKFVPCAPDEDTGAPTCETVTVGWYPKTLGLCTFHAVVRDGAGGTAWLSQTFEIQ